MAKIVRKTRTFGLVGGFRFFLGAPCAPEKQKAGSIPLPAAFSRSDPPLKLLLRLFRLTQPLGDFLPELIAPDDGVRAHARAAPIAALRAYAREVQAFGLDHIRPAFGTAASHLLSLPYRMM